MPDATRGVDAEPNDRAQQLLRTLVECYIRDGQPVGSRTLTRESGLSLSPATIRNVIADLEEHGFVSSPHTSAGRVPTDKGYRYFVDRLTAPGRLDDARHQRVGEFFEHSRASLEHLLRTIIRLGVDTAGRVRHKSLLQKENDNWFDCSGQTSNRTPRVSRTVARHGPAC